jgi:Uncharacterised MFS-type transporter YbfB
VSLRPSGKQPTRGLCPGAIALAGLIALATAMGIGRFAFTPLLPMMLHDGVVDLTGASWLASANYVGYLVGALLCTFQPMLWRRVGRWAPLVTATWVRGGLVATALLTLGMALPAPWLWPLLRFAAGIASAFVFIFTSGWCLSQLALHNASRLGGVMYAGPGAGIALSGLFASGMVAMHWSASAGWLVFGLLAAVLTAAAWRAFGRGASSSSGGAPAAAAPPAPLDGREVGVLAFAYGLAGFGYIVTATFLPVIARQALPGSAWLDLFWPLFGLGVVTGALLSSRISLALDLRLLLAACYGVQALAVGLSALWPTLAGFALSSWLLGVPFTAITFFAMQEVRRLRPASPASLMGLLTALYGLGQIAGPPLVALLLRGAPSLAAGFTRSLELAAGSLLLGAALYLWMSRAWPVGGRRARI